MIRVALRPDADQIAEIYRPFVTHSTVSFEEVAPDAGEIAQRIERANLWLVDVVGERVRASVPEGRIQIRAVARHHLDGPTAGRIAARENSLRSEFSRAESAR